MINIGLVYSGGKYFGGIETYVLNLFRNQGQDKVKIYLFSLGEWPLTNKVREVGGEVIVLSGTRLQPFTIFKIATEAKKRGVKLLVSGGLVADSYARAASLFSGIPHLSVVHSFFDLDYPNILVRIVYKLALALSSWRTKKYIAVSDFLKRVLIKNGVKEKKIAVIPNGVDFPSIKKQKNISTTVGSFGRLHSVKGYESLILAAQDILAAKIIIWGEGPEKDKLEKLILRNNLTSKIRLAGFTTEPWEKLSEFDIYVQPSKMEGFGLAVIEAMGMGLPVVVTSVGSLSEIVEDGRTGLVVKSNSPNELAEKINILIQDEKLREKLGLAAQKEVRGRYDVKKWAQKTVEAFLEAAK